MPWRFKKGALRKLRRAEGVDIAVLAGRLGISPKAVRNHEKGGGVRNQLLATYFRFFKIHKENEEAKQRRAQLVYWVDHGAPAEEPREVEPAGKLELLARRERELGLAEQTVTADGSPRRLLGLDLWHECHHACDLHREECLAVTGTIHKRDPVPEPAARRIDAPFGAGTRVVLLRQVARGLLFYATVFTRTAAHTRQIIECAKSGKPITVLVKMIVSPPETQEKWKGFLIYQREKSSPALCPFAFVVQNIFEAQAPDRPIPVDEKTG